MKTRLISPRLLASMLLALLVSGCDEPTRPKSNEETEEPTTGRLRITTATAGSSLDTDGYVVTVDGGEEAPIGVNQAAPLDRRLDPGEHEVELRGVASNCAVIGVNPQVVTVVAGGTTWASFEINCDIVGGWLQITTATTGNPLDVDVYLVRVDGKEMQSIGLSETVTLTQQLEAGDHDVSLAGVAPNCEVEGATPKSVAVVADDTASSNFTVDCIDMGWLQIAVTTTGASLDADGYGVTVDGGDQGLIETNQTLTLARPWSPGEREVELTGLASNCTVTGANPQMVTVVANETASASFEVACSLVLRDIAFASNRAGDNDIYAMDADGSNLTRLTTLGVWGDPAWSPDGTKIAFSRDETGWFDLRIYVMDADGSNPVRIGPGVLPAWSPDGSRIAYTGTTDVWIMNADGSNPINVTSNQPPSNSSPAWSPDGMKIAFTTGRDGNVEVYVMNSDGSGYTNLTNHPGYDRGPAWSPDGRKIAFSSKRDGDLDVYVMNADGSNLVRLTHHPANDYDPAWSPDGTKLAFTSNRDGNLEVYVMNADGSNPINLTNHPANDERPAWRH